MKFLLLLFLSMPAFAWNTGVLTLSGTIASDCRVEIATTSQSTSLNVLNGSTNVLVATVTETCNELNGYKITASSLNNGLLKGPLSTPYQISYDGSAFMSLTTDQVLKNVTSLSSKVIHDSAVLVNVTALPDGITGTYQDVVTISIEAN